MSDALSSLRNIFDLKHIFERTKGSENQRVRNRLMSGIGNSKESRENERGII